MAQVLIIAHVMPHHDRDFYMVAVDWESDPKIRRERLKRIGRRFQVAPHLREMDALEALG